MEPWIVLVCLALEAAVGYPPALHARIPHPVVWIGEAVDGLEARWNVARYSFAQRRALGIAAVTLVTVAAIGVGALLQQLQRWGAPGGLLVAAIGSVGLAQHSLFVHVNDVLRSLRAGDL